MDPDVEAPNILAITASCARPPNYATSPMLLKQLVIGDRLRVTRIQSDKESDKIPLCTKKNRVHWLQSSPPRYQAVAIEACLTMMAERVEKLVLARTMGGGTSRARQRFFDPFEKRERNLPRQTDVITTKFHGLVRLTFARIPAGTQAHSHIKCYVPEDYSGNLSHYVATKEDTYFAPTLTSVFEPTWHTRVAEAEQVELLKLMESSDPSPENVKFGDLLTAVSALIKCCADKERRKGNQPSRVDLGECWRLVQKHAFTDLQRSKYEGLRRLLEASLMRLMRPAGPPEASLELVDAGRVNWQSAIPSDSGVLQTAELGVVAYCEKSLSHRETEYLEKRPISFINMEVPSDKVMYDKTEECGMIEIQMRRRTLPDERLLFGKKDSFGKLRHTQALLVGYPLEKLKLHTWGRYLMDTETPESVGLEDGEIVKVELEPMTNFYDTSRLES